jgi:hypothetical protein
MNILLKRRKSKAKKSRPPLKTAHPPSAASIFRIKYGLEAQASAVLLCKFVGEFHQRAVLATRRPQFEGKLGPSLCAGGQRTYRHYSVVFRPGDLFQGNCRFIPSSAKVHFCTFHRERNPPSRVSALGGRAYPVDHRVKQGLFR